MAMRAVAVALTALAVGSSVVALIMSALHQPVPGVAVTRDATSVRWVLPGGPAWNDGVRVGQRVRALDHGDVSHEWRIVVSTREGVDYASTATSHREALRAATPVALGALMFGALAALAVRHRVWRLAGAVASLAVASASWPLMLTAQPGFGVAAAIGSTVIPAGWLAVSGSGWLHRLPIAAAMLAAVIWLAGRFVWPELFELADAARLGLLWLCVAALALKILPWRGWATVKPVIDTSRHADIAGMAAAAASVMVVGALVNLPLWVAGAGAIGVALVYAPVRQWTGRALDRLLVSDQREQARIAAVEDERFRLASEIHDVPLQEISGVIRRLERIDGAESEADLLRDVAEHLRDITGELHPPVLADLGLVPALRAATEEADRLGPPSVVCQLDEDTGLLADQRLPRTVELAVYRIVQEAIANARLHAGASSVLVSGRVSPRWLEVAVRDDGAGLDQSALRAAQRLGHLGVTSMLQRAEAIGAELRIEPASPGTTVTLEWSLG